MNVLERQINADGENTHIFPWLQPNYAILKKWKKLFYTYMVCYAKYGQISV